MEDIFLCFHSQAVRFTIVFIGLTQFYVVAETCFLCPVMFVFNILRSCRSVWACSFLCVLWLAYHSCWHSNAYQTKRPGQSRECSRTGLARCGIRANKFTQTMQWRKNGEKPVYLMTDSVWRYWSNQWIPFLFFVTQAETKVCSLWWHSIGPWMCKICSSQYWKHTRARLLEER